MTPEEIQLQIETINAQLVPTRREKAIANIVGYGFMLLATAELVTYIIGSVHNVTTEADYKII